MTRKHPSHRAIGDHGETIAREYLEREGYAILATGYTIRGGEIDIVAYRDRTTVFVEVKYRRSVTHGTAVEGFTAQKRARLMRAIETYCNVHAVDPETIRVDLIAIQEDRDGRAIQQHFEAVEMI